MLRLTIQLLTLLPTYNWVFCLNYYCIDIQGKIKQCPGNTRPEFTSDLIAFAKYSNRINSTGWAELELATNERKSNNVQAYYAGMLEGYITAPLIQSHQLNILPDREKKCQDLSFFLKRNLNQIIENIKKNNDLYWQEVGLVLYQIAGLDDGFSRARNIGTYQSRPHLDLNLCGILLINMVAEFGELYQILGISKEIESEDHCSAIIKILPNFEDVLVSHNTWTNPNIMLRIFKRYTLNYSTSKAKSIAMSSYPGLIFSLDDYYITSQKLVILETTNKNYNQQLYKEVVVDQIVLEFIRNAVANRLASDGKEWVEVFEKHNSGTYNNQFMIVDFKQFVHKKKIRPGFLWVLEQLPTQVISADMTQELVSKMYWPSYNVPYFRETFMLSLFYTQIEKYGDQFSYDECARAQIFRRDHSKVVNVTTLFHLMRYNDYLNDPISRCNCSPPYTADRAIASRNDLNDPKGRYPFYDYSLRPSMAIDAKMTSSKMAAKLESVVVSGPTDENVEPFDWSSTLLRDNVFHLDQPTLWRFKPVITKWDQPNRTFPEFKFNF